MAFPFGITVRGTTHKPTGGASATDGTYNEDRDELAKAITPDNCDDTSADNTAFQKTVDPGEDGTESRPTNLDGEIWRLRKLILEITGKTYWYESPSESLLVAGMPLGYVYGFQPKHDTDTAHDILIGVGECREEGDTVSMAHTTAMTKQIDAAFAEGDDAGGMDTGTVANSTLYAIYAIGGSGKTTDFVFSTELNEATGPTPPTGFTYWRLITYVLTDGSANIRNGTWNGPFEFWFDAQQSVVSDSTITDDTAETGTAVGPPNSILIGNMHIEPSTSNTMSSLDIYPIGGTRGTSGQALASAMLLSGGSSGVNQAAPFEVLTDGSKQFLYKAHESGGTVEVKVQQTGWRINLGVVGPTAL
tara:strand:- start:3551 stop:4633 length:1083 start_codon:yes stop_codon:yes gene_type:complete